LGHSYYSYRTGANPHANGLPFQDILDLFVLVCKRFRSEGYFDEAFGFHCVDSGYSEGSVPDIKLEILLKIRKKDLWPLDENAQHYSEHDLFDIIEFLYQYVSKPITGTLHGYGDCGMHWEVFNQAEGRDVFREKINEVLSHYIDHYELSPEGEILQKVEAGFEPLMKADIPATGSNIKSDLMPPFYAFAGMVRLSMIKDTPLGIWQTSWRK